MHLEWSALTLASHLCLVFSIVCAFLNAAAVRRNWQAPVSVAFFTRLEGPVFVLAATLMVERLYYVCARLLVGSDLNLWRAHPAPEMLSFSITVSLFWLAAAIRHLDATPGNQARKTVALQSLCVGVLFISVAWGLW